MEADFSGYATKAGLKCSDGRTIMPGAFKHQDTMQVPLVWQHGHSDPENVLGHAVLEDREDGVFAYGFFNRSNKAEQAKELLRHKDIKMLSIWANELMERSGRVIHGAIREVSLVISGANPGALIENVTIRHSDGMSEDVLDDEAIITSGEEVNVPDAVKDDDNADDKSDDEDANTDDNDNSTDSGTDDADNDSGSDDSTDDSTDDSSEESDDTTEDGEVKHAAGDDKTLEDVYDSMTDEQKQVLHYMVSEAINASASDSIAQDNLDNDDTDTQKGTEMTHNVFDEDSTAKGYSLTYADYQGIVADATKSGSLKEAVKDFALSHGIEDIEMLFPDAKAIDTVPEFLKRRSEWVAKVLGAARKSPFSRIKTLSADLTEEEARAKGYITGNLKKEEFFGVSKRVTTPTTVYKKQKLDRDDMLDITDFDVVAWLKGEMRLMLDEELGRAILIGDGRDIAK